jgi:adenylate cyclase
MERRLAAILAADMVGYSRLMEQDEAGTLAALRERRKGILQPLVAQHHGRVVKVMGDGVLVEFASAVNAVQCAVDLQQGIAAANAGRPYDKHIVLRIGVNLGDVIVEGSDLYGDGVNIAARLEAVAEPGGVCVSGKVYDEVRNKLDLRFDDLGLQHVKNIAEPVRVYRVRLEFGGSGYSADSAAAGGIPPLPDKPSIAVLPFENMSGDPEQEFFADGIVDEIITELSRFPDLFVIARNSAFTYKGQAVKVQQVGRELGVAHVVEGSVRKAGNRIRIAIQLIDAATGNHMWAERYDRELVDIFDLQDEITRAIVGVLPGRVELAAVARLKRKRLSDMAAYDYVLAGKIHHDRETRDDNIEALRMLDKAIELEPGYATAWAWRACTLGQAIALGYADDPEVAYRQAVEAVRKALMLDENDVNCHRLLCEVNMEERRLDQAQRHHDKAFELNPNDVRIVAQRGELLTWLGRREEGAAWVEKAMRLDPFGSHKRAHLLGRALHAARRYGAAVDAFKLIQSPRYPNLADMAACYAQMGEPTAAEALAAEVLRVKPDFSADAYVAKLPYQEADDRAHHREGLRKAGLPE